MSTQANRNAETVRDLANELRDIADMLELALTGDVRAVKFLANRIDRRTFGFVVGGHTADELVSELTVSRKCWEYAKREQGYTGSYGDWAALTDAEREEYEIGAAGIATV